MTQYAAASSGVLPSGFELAGRYRIRGELGRGGMGVVYEAEHLALGRDVALKTLHPRLLEDQDAVARFVREARTAASIGHPGIVHVFDLGTDQGITFLAMERLRGEDLRQRLKRAGRLSIPRVIALGHELAQAISAAHQRGILHRDLTPRNVFLATDDLGNERVKVLDFGVAKLTESLPTESVTQSQQVFGTLMYMPPERVGGEPADVRSDVYAIGALMYEALSGTSPFAMCSYAELALRITLESPVPLRTLRPDCPAHVVEVVESAMHRDASKRWASAQALAAALHATSAEPQDSAESNPEHTETAAPGAAPVRKQRRRSIVAVAASAVLLIGLGALTARSRPAVRRPATAPQAARIPAAARRTEASATTHTAAAGKVAAPAPSAQPAALSPSGGIEHLTQELDVISHPPGAIITVDGDAPCRAPCSLHVPVRGRSVLRAYLTGHGTLERQLRQPLPEVMELWLPPRKAVATPARHEHVSAGAAALPPLLPRR